jgi:hypothetical protein
MKIIKRIIPFYLLDEEKGIKIQNKKRNHERKLQY